MRMTMNQARCAYQTTATQKTFLGPFANLSSGWATTAGRAWHGMEDDFSIFHTGIFFHSILKIVHSIFHSILPYQGKFRPEGTRNLYCNQVVLAKVSIMVRCIAKLPKTFHRNTQNKSLHKKND